MSNDTEAEVTSAQKAEALTGMGIPEEELLPAVETKVVETKVETEKSEEPTEEVEPEEKKEEKKEDDKDRPAKSERPLRAAFTQIKELRSSVDKILSKLDTLSPAKQEAVEVVEDALKTLAEKRGLDADGLKEIGEVLQKQILDNLEKQGLLKKDLPVEIQDKLKLLDKFEADVKAREENALFEREFNEYLPELEKQYPNAKSAEKNEMKKLLDELSHAKDFHDKDLDYVWFKNKSKFDAIGKVAKGTKSGETSSKQIVDDDSSDEINLDPEDMTPEKAKAYQLKKLRER